MPVVIPPLINPETKVAKLSKRRAMLGNNKMCSGSEAGWYLRLIDICITQL